jgi:hypothetical protein
MIRGPGARSGVVGLWQTGGPTRHARQWLGRIPMLLVPREALNVKKLLALAVAAGGVFFVLRRKSAAKAEADLWREATAGDKKA